MRSLQTAGLVALMFVAAPATAADRGAALVIGNHDYAHAPDADTAARDAQTVAKALADAGWDVTLGTDLDRFAMRRVIARFADRAEDAGQLLIFYSGHALRTGGDTYLAPVDAQAETLTDVLFDGVPLSLLLRTAAEKPGRAAVFLDGAQLRGFTPTGFVEPGLAALEGPDGVIIVSAAEPGKAIARSPWRDSRFAQLITGRFLKPGAGVNDTARDAGGPTYVTGEVDAGMMLVPAPEPVIGAGDDDLAREIELAYWRTAERSGDAGDYRAYLERFPNGIFAQFARDRLGIAENAQVPDQPEVDPRIEAEQALNLSRIRKRKVQEWLLALGHDPNGIDGLFGRGSRAAIQSWQKASGIDPSGYLDADQFAALQGAGEAAMAEQRRIAEEKRRIAEAEDNGYWAATGARGKPEDYRAYLDRYPEGLHAAAARAALDSIAEAEADEAARREQRAFQRAAREDTPEAYRDYLGKYPKGIYADKALARLDEIETAERESLQRDALATGEDALDLSDRDRLSVEQRLRSLGFAPGMMDGIFDERTRAAISGYQAARGLGETGYLDRPTLVTLVRETNRPKQGAQVVDGARVVQELLRALGGRSN